MARVWQPSGDPVESSIFTDYGDIWFDLGKAKGSDSDLTNFFNYVAADRANQHEIDMWKMNNEYNSPANQVSRYIAAGFNPHTIVGQVSSGNAQSTPGTHQAHYKFTENAEKMAKIQTALQAVSTLLNGVGSVIGSAQGVQNLQLGQQQHNLMSDEEYLSLMRYQALTGHEIPNVAVGNKAALAGYLPGQYQHLYGDTYATNKALILFPELRQAATMSQNADLLPSRQESLDSSTALRNKQMEIDRLVDSVIESTFKGNPNWQDILKLIILQLSKRY